MPTARRSCPPRRCARADPAAVAAWFTRLRVVDAFGRFIDLPPSAVTASAIISAAAASRPGARASPRSCCCGPGSPARGGCCSTSSTLVRLTAPPRPWPWSTSPTRRRHRQPRLRMAAARPLRRGARGVRRRGRTARHAARRPQAGRGLGRRARPPGPRGRPAVRRCSRPTPPRGTWYGCRPPWSRPTRSGEPTRTPRPPEESALSALLRVIDTTSWTIDPFGALGTEHSSVLDRPARSPSSGCTCRSRSKRPRHRTGTPSSTLTPPRWRPPGRLRPAEFTADHRAAGRADPHGRRRARLLRR